eukprot:CAMPEP_0176321284 /NCGR_PEP_ID=MMETSP0121_2-20121125/71266_1 /TAXON_ID=160619 /ORGANISM="Kryptoperidinium foliaceum, Strain CCMP 1326" /LENGTH=896 /DNA_ID=CAMNT_0017663715 /DNA_START=69 /DNA_END=2759 /DNA_ORIENTATION=+
MGPLRFRRSLPIGLPISLAALSAAIAARAHVACSPGDVSCAGSEDGSSALLQVSHTEARRAKRQPGPPSRAGHSHAKMHGKSRMQRAMDRMYYERMGMKGAIPGGTLNATDIPKYVTPLVIPPAMKTQCKHRFESELRQFQQQILPGGIWNNPAFGLVAANATHAFPPTTVWSYGPKGDPMPDSTDLGGGAGIAPAANSQFNYPAYTFEVLRNQATHVTWSNGLVRDPIKCSGHQKEMRACLQVCRLRGHKSKCEAKCGKILQRDGDSCKFLPHLLPVDQTLHWANPGQLPCKGERTTDCMPDPSALSDPSVIQKPYEGPVPMVVHVHGTHATPDSDGYPEAWWLPAASDIPEGYASTGTFTNRFARKTNQPGMAHYKYDNKQPSTTLWLHDHTLGMTRQNVYAGPAGFWLVRDEEATSKETGLLKGELPGPAPQEGEGLAETNLPGAREKFREIPIVIQDRSFNTDGSLFYPDNREFFSSPKTVDVPYKGGDVDSDIPPIWNPEAFFNVMVVNGVSWPVHQVKRGLYRFRLLNGCNSRFLNLFLVTIPGGSGHSGWDEQVPLYMIGGDQSLLPKVVKVTKGHKTVLPGDGTEPSAETPAGDPEEALVLGPAERADVIVDFSHLPAGTVVRMVNTGPDEPFGGFPTEPSDPGTTGQVMEFHVLPQSCDKFTKPKDLVLSLAELWDPACHLNTSVSNSRDLTLMEDSSKKICVNEDDTSITYDPEAVPKNNDECVLKASGAPASSAPFAPQAAVLGVGNSNSSMVTMWSDKIVTDPEHLATEEWVIWNKSPDAHPIHVHLIKFLVVNREAIDEDTGALSGVKLAPPPNEAGWKDTIISYPFQVTRLRMTFDLPGLFVWHCHILEHEDNEMMVPFCVGDMKRDKACRLHNELAGNGHM